MRATSPTRRRDRRINLVQHHLEIRRSQLRIDIVRASVRCSANRRRVGATGADEQLASRDGQREIDVAGIALEQYAVRGERRVYVAAVHRVLRSQRTLGPPAAGPPPRRRSSRIVNDAGHAVRFRDPQHLVKHLARFGLRNRALEQRHRLPTMTAITVGMLWI